MNKVVVVSGASSGIGYAIATLLHNQGYQVIGLSRTLPKLPYAYDYLLADITNEKQVNDITEKIANDYGHVYALINCAGMGISGAVEHTQLTEVQKILNVNIVGAFLMSKAFIPQLRGHKGSKIINISSVAGELTVPFQTFYSMTKSAMNAFTAGLALELKPFGISVGSILPGDTATNFTQNREKSLIETDEFYQDRIKRSIERMEKDELNGKDPMSVAKVVAKLLKKKRLPLMVTVGFQYKLFVFLKRILPTRLAQFILYQLYSK